MELLDRYLLAVRKNLPWKRQDDIIAELRVNLESQLDEREAELGRPLTATEAELWISELGSPAMMASRYQPQQYLIGPQTLPAYLHILRLASAWTIAVYLLVSVINAVAAAKPTFAAIAGAVLKLPFVLIQVAAWITLLFAALEFFAAHFPEYCPSFAGLHGKWTPRDLPPLERVETRGKKRRSYGMAMTEAAFGFVALGWLLLVPQNPWIMFGPGVAYLQASPYELAPIWMTIYWWIVGLNAVQVAWRCIDLLRGAWQRRDVAQEIVVKTMGLVPLIVLVSNHDKLYVLLKRPELDQVQHGQTLLQTNHGIHSVALLLIVIVSAQLAWDIAQALIAAARKRAAAK